MPYCALRASRVQRAGAASQSRSLERLVVPQGFSAGPSCHGQPAILMDDERRETACLCKRFAMDIETTSLRLLLYLARLLTPQPAPPPLPLLQLLLPSALLRSQLRLQLLELEQGLQHLSWYADTTTGSTGRWCSRRRRRRRWSSS
eukprot:COSAG06_NODE_1698_length_8693_cov_92.740517_2_plen_146_part_00